MKPCSVRHPFLANDAIHEVSGTGFDCPLSQHRAVKGTMFNMHFLSDPMIDRRNGQPNISTWSMKAQRISVNFQDPAPAAGIFQSKKNADLTNPRSVLVLKTQHFFPVISPAGTVTYS